MHKKSPRAVPDFSRHPPQQQLAGTHGPQPDTVKQAPTPRTPQPATKPHSTSSKSGRRGQ